MEERYEKIDQETPKRYVLRYLALTVFFSLVAIAAVVMLVLNVIVWLR